LTALKRRIRVGGKKGEERGLGWKKKNTWSGEKNKVSCERIDLFIKHDVMRENCGRGVEGKVSGGGLGEGGDRVF